MPANQAKFGGTVIQGAFPHGLPHVLQALMAVPSLKPNPAEAPLPFPGQPVQAKSAGPAKVSTPPPVRFPNQSIASVQSKPTVVPPAKSPVRFTVPLPTPTAKPTVAAPTAAQPKAMQPSGGGQAFQVPPTLNLNNPGGGQRLPEAVQKKMEAFFGTSFDDVRVHVGPQAASIGALAFTHGTNLYFAPGQYNPTTVLGQQLLGHELTHVVQQRAGRVRNPYGAGVAVVQDLAMEAEADRMGFLLTSFGAARANPENGESGLSRCDKFPSLGAVQPRTRPLSREGERLPPSVRNTETETGDLAARPSLPTGSGARGRGTRHSPGAVQPAFSLPDLLAVESFDDQIYQHLTAIDLSSLARVCKRLRAVYLAWVQRVKHSRRLLEAPRQGAPNMIELGAGPMLSASHFWGSVTDVDFTEFRDLPALIGDYGGSFGVTLNVLAKRRTTNRVLLGVDATRLESCDRLLDTSVLRFTNPNIGNQDVTDALKTVLKYAGNSETPGNFWVRSGRQFFHIDFAQCTDEGCRAWLLKPTQQQHRKAFGWLKQTGFVIAACRNIMLLSQFFRNAAKKLKKDGIVELIVMENYVKLWQIEALVKSTGWTIAEVDNVELGFEHTQTQEARAVSHQSRKCVKIRLRPNEDFIQSIESLGELFGIDLNAPLFGNHLITEVTTEYHGPYLTIGYSWD